MKIPQSSHDAIWIEKVQMTAFNWTRWLAARCQEAKDRACENPFYITFFFPALHHKVSHVLKAYSLSASITTGRRPRYRLLKHHVVASTIARATFLTARGEHTVAIKILPGRTPEEVERHRTLIREEYGTLRLLESAVPAAHCSVVPPLALVEDQLAIVTEYVDGIRLDDLFLAKAFTSFGSLLSELKFLFNQLGRWLNGVYQSTPRSDSINSYLDHKINELASLAQDLFPRQSESQSFIEGTLALRKRIQTRTLHISKCHGDLIPSNLIYSNGRLYVTDLSDQHNGLIYEDLARLYQWLEYYRERRPWVDSRQITEIQNAFLNGFCPTFDPMSAVFVLCRVLDLSRTIKILKDKAVTWRRLAPGLTKRIKRRTSSLLTLSQTAAESFP